MSSKKEKVTPMSVNMTPNQYAGGNVPAPYPSQGAYYGGPQMQHYPNMIPNQDVPTYQVTAADVQQHYQQQMGMLRPPNFQHMQPYNMYPMSEMISLPEELTSFITSGQIQPILLKVKEQSGAGYITVETDGNGKSSVLIHAASPNIASTARLLVEIHLKEHMKYMNDISRLNKMQENLYEVQGEVAAGQRIEFHCPHSLLGVMIGAEGKRIKEVKSVSGVRDINIDGETGLVEIVGPSASSVQTAREMLRLIQEDVELTKDEAITMLKDSSYFRDLREMSKCIVCRIPQGQNYVTLIGTEASVNSAKLILATQKEYVLKRAEVRESQSTIRSQLRTIEKNFRPRGSDRRYPYKAGNTRGDNRSHGTTTKDSLQNLENGDTSAMSTTTTAIATPASMEEASNSKSESKKTRDRTKNNDAVLSEETQAPSSKETFVETPSYVEVEEKLATVVISNEPSKRNSKAKKKAPARSNKSSSKDNEKEKDIEAIAAAIVRESEERKNITVSSKPSRSVTKEKSSSLESLPPPPGEKENTSSLPLPPRSRKKGGSSTRTTSSAGNKEEKEDTKASVPSVSVVQEETDTASSGKSEDVTAMKERGNDKNSSKTSSRRRPLPYQQRKRRPVNGNGDKSTASTSSVQDSNPASEKNSS